MNKLNTFLYLFEFSSNFKLLCAVLFNFKLLKYNNNGCTIVVIMRVVIEKKIALMMYEIVVVEA